MNKPGAFAEPVPSYAALSLELREHADDINTALLDLVVEQVAAYTDSANPEVLPQLERHLRDHGAVMADLIAGRKAEKLDFIQAHAESSARQRFPLEYLLHTYRCLNGFYVRWLHESILSGDTPGLNAPAVFASLTEAILDYTDRASQAATRHYLAQAQLLAAVSGDERALLLRILLEGYDESDGRVAGVLRRAGYLDGRRAFCVALARSVDPAEMLNPSRARRMADYITGLFDGMPGKQLVDVRNQHVTIIFSDTRRVSGWTAASASLASKIVPVLNKVGPAALIGISNDAPATATVPRAYREAQLALEAAHVSRRVVQFGQMSLQELMIRSSAGELMRVMPQWAEPFLSADQRSGGVLVATLKAYARASMNVLKAAAILGSHPNTVYARFDRVTRLTGLRPRKFADLTELLIVADCRGHC
ncbi:MAG: hypothetical protein HKO64_01990 [Xanthomonadales bacterium]|nr:helix-turn-helix domain-containing protein [Gammaproteobacteria bacterium]NNE05608.1 hypothetical protein [Xanthomonadales bacterium]NNL94372.1 hypothetical protein [Xanthomonadales bacterium]